MKTNSKNYTEILEEICTTTIAPEAEKIDRNGTFPEKSINTLKKSGLLGAVSSPEVDGLGLGIRGATTVVERIGQECGSTAMVVMMHFSGTAVLEAFASKEIREAAARGQHLSTLAFSESSSRSHFWTPTGTASRNDNTVVLNAHKSWVTSATQATAYVWSSQPVESKERSTLWLVPANSDGLSIDGVFNGLGLRGNNSSSIVASKVKVPFSARLGPDGSGFDTMIKIVLPMFCLCNAAASVGFMRAAIDRTASHATHTQYEHVPPSLADLPTIRNYIGRMKVITDASRSLLLEAVSAVENERTNALFQVLSSKAAAGESVTQVLDLAMRICGGSAFRKDVGVERYFRDARAAGIMGPTTDLLYDFIGKTVCGLELFS